MITEKNFEYLNISKPKEAKFYLLPKIHKKDIPGRPICSSIDHPTSNISNYVDEHIQNMYQEPAYMLETLNTSSVDSNN